MAMTFVTGGSGFIGQALIRRLIGEGHTVRALVRSDAAATKVAALGAEPVRGELTDASTWQDAVVSSEVLFHLAAETDITAPREQHERVTIGGTKAALEAARHANVSRFVHCGSEAALLAGEPLIEVDETAPLRPDSEAAYCAVKALSEELVLSTTDLATVSIRPRFVWGPHSLLVEGLVEAARAGQFAWLGDGRHRTDITHVDNAVEGLILGWRRGRAGEAYFVTDGRRVVLREFLEEQFAQHGPATAIPETDPAGTPVPARWFLGQPCLLRIDKATTELGYQPLNH